MTEALYYRPSGRIGFRGPLLMALGSLAGAILLGAIYGYWMWYVIVLLKFFAPLAYGSGVGLIVGQAAHLAKVRNGAFVGAFGAAVGVLSVYTGWVFWLLAWSEQSYFSPLSDTWWFSAIAEAAVEGVDQDDETFQGGTLYIWWTVEAVVIVGSSVLNALWLVGASDNTFCEACEEWAEDVYWSPVLEAIGAEEGFQAELEADPLRRLVAIRRAAPGEYGTFSRIRIQACPSCQFFFCLDVQKIKRWENHEGPDGSSQTVLVDNLLIDKRTHDRLARHFPNAGKPSS